MTHDNVFNFCNSFYPYIINIFTPLNNLGYYYNYRYTLITALAILTPFYRKNPPMSAHSPVYFDPY